MLSSNNGRGGRPGASDPELVERAKRRRFTSEYKLRVLGEADACKQAGEVGALLRREGLYSSHLAQWRKLRAQGARAALSRPRGRKQTPPLEVRTRRCADVLNELRPSWPRRAR